MCVSRVGWCTPWSGMDVEVILMYGLPRRMWMVEVPMYLRRR